jgi:hypothetical protein
MPHQDRESGAAAVEYGLDTAVRIAEALGAAKIGSSRSNEYVLKGRKVVIKCARTGTSSVGVSYRMIERLDSVIGSFETDKPGTYDLYEMSSATYIENMRPTHSKGTSSGKVGIVRKSVFLKQGNHINTVRL